MDPSSLVEWPVAVRTDEPQRQIWLGLDQTLRITVQYFWRRGTFIGVFVYRENLLAHFVVLQEPIVRVKFRIGLRADLGLPVVSSSIRTVGHHHREFDEGLS